MNCVALLRLVLIGGAGVDALRGKKGRVVCFVLLCGLGDENEKCNTI